MEHLSIKNAARRSVCAAVLYVIAATTGAMPLIAAENAGGGATGTNALLVAKREKAPAPAKQEKQAKKTKAAKAKDATAKASASTTAPTSLPVTFTDSLGRSVTVTSCARVAVLQGSLAAVWLLAGGKVAATTHDAFVEPPALSVAQAAALNDQWHTTAFRSHGAGVFALAERVAADSAASADGSATTAVAAPAAYGASTGSAPAADVGTMMNPNSELLLAAAPDFVILSANISGHKKLLPLLENAGIPCAYFNYETFSQYLHILDIFTRLTARADLYAEHGARVEAACNAQIATALAKRDGAAPATAAQGGTASTADTRATMPASASAARSASTGSAPATAAQGSTARTADTRAATPSAAATGAPTVLLLRAFGTGVLAKDSRSLAAGDLLAALGTQNIADTGTLATGDLSLEAIIAADPSFIFVTTMGTDEAKALAAFQAKLASSPAWSGLTAVKAGRCVVLPRELFHFKPLGANWLACYQILTAIIYGN